MLNIEALIVSQVLKNDDNLDVAFRTNNSWNIIQSSIGLKFISALEENLKCRLPQEIPELSKKWIFKNETNGTIINWKIQNKKWEDNYELAICDEGSGSERGLYFSVYSKIEATRKDFHDKIFELLEEGQSLEEHWWTWTKAEYKYWEQELKTLKEFAFSEQFSNALNYFSDRLVFLVQTIENIRRNDENY